MAAATTKTIRLPVHGNVKLPDLHAAIARDGNLRGCLAFGLVGGDLQILGGDAAVESEFKGITGRRKGTPRPGD
jgi:hypothetical protein